MKRKGFTLVELLAVIVILVIIALIATPMILGVIDESRRKAAIISAENYMYAVEQYLVLQEVENYSVKLQNNTTYKVEEDTVFEFSLMDIIIPKVYALPSETVFLNDIIKIKGEYPKDGYVEIGENKIITAELVSNNYIVTCTSSNNCDITGDYSSNIVAVQSVEINELEETRIGVGETLQLFATVLPEDATNKKVTWTSNNNEIATVDENGLVIANQEGTVTITATTKNRKADTIEIKVELPKLCKRSTALHTEECTQTDSTNYCSGAGYTSTNKGTTITYGSLGTDGILASGDAFDCDVNGDGIYDENNERFYYVSDLESNPNYAVLIYYNNTTNGVADNTSSSLIAYDSSNKNYQGPVTGITNLPTTKQWNSVSLSSTSRAINNQSGGTTSANGNYTLPTTFSYIKTVDGEPVPLAARLLTAQEINSACRITVGNHNAGELDGCNYLMENTKYSSSSMETSGYWLENSDADSSYDVWMVFIYNRTVDRNYAYTASSRGVRPAIEVLKSDILY